MTPARLRFRLRPAIVGGGQAVRLTPQEATVLLAVMARPEVAAAELAELLWPDPDAMPDFWRDNIGAVLCTLNAKLRPFGWDVVARVGFGWRLVRTDEPLFFPRWRGRTAA